MGTDIHAVWQAKKNGSWKDVESKWKQDRHYLLFSWLADVRNGSGFAGVKTYDPIKPISVPRGLPADFDQESHDTEDIWMGDHSFSWLTAEEILAAEPPKVHRCGVISLEQFRAWDGKSQPASWSGWILGRDIVVSAPELITEHTTHVKIAWDEPEGSLDYFIQEVRRMKELYKEVRIVFGFDS